MLPLSNKPGHATTARMRRLHKDARYQPTPSGRPLHRMPGHGCETCAARTDTVRIPRRAQHRARPLVIGKGQARIKKGGGVSLALFTKAPAIARPSCLFVVPGEPVPCGRPRSRAFIAYEGGKPVARLAVHPDPKSDAYEQAIGLVARAARPTGWRTDWAAYELRVRVWQSERRGDGDNFVKAVADGCAGKKGSSGTWERPPVLWDNDRRIKKWIVEIGDDLDRPRLEVLATMIGDLSHDDDQKARTRLLAQRRRASVQEGRPR